MVSSTAPLSNTDSCLTLKLTCVLVGVVAVFLRLTALATPLVLFPRVLSLIFSAILTADPINGETTTTVIRELNVLEKSLAGLAGLAMLSFAAILVVQVSY